VALEAFVLGLGKHIAAGSAGYGSAAASPPGAGAAADRAHYDHLPGAGLHLPGAGLQITVPDGLRRPCGHDRSFRRELRPGF
jgi:hypothetical protein